MFHKVEPAFLPLLSFRVEEWSELGSCDIDGKAGGRVERERASQPLKFSLILFADEKNRALDQAVPACPTLALNCNFEGKN